MVFAEAAIALFVWVLGFVALYASYKRDALGWGILSAVLFLVDIGYSRSIPFSVNEAGKVILTSANMFLGGLSFLFGVIAIFRTVYIAFEIMKARN